MGQARELMDKVTAAVVAKDAGALIELYAPDAVAFTPDAGELQGREKIIDWMMQFAVAFPDTHFDLIAQHEEGDSAYDEGYLIGTHTGPLAMPEGELAPTHREVRIRECDVIDVRDGMIREHRFYFDQAQMMEQLGLVPT